MDIGLVSVAKELLESSVFSHVTLFFKICISHIKYLLDLVEAKEKSYIILKFAISTTFTAFIKCLTLIKRWFIHYIKRLYQFFKKVIG